MTAPTLSPNVEAPAVVRVRHTLWHLMGRVDYIAKPLIDGEPVEFVCGERWCRLAAGGAALQIAAALKADYGLSPSYSFQFRDGCWHIAFTLEVM